jgi:thiamine transport system permease protein
MAQDLGKNILKLIGVSFFGIFLVIPLLMLFSNGAVFDFPFNLVARNIFQAFISASLSIIIALPLAWALTKKTPLTRILRALSIVPLVLPQPAMILSLIILFGNNGLLNILPFSLYGLEGIVLAHCLYNFPLAARIISSKWSGSESFELAARTLGASKLRAFLFVTLPSLKAPISSAFIVAFSFSFTSFAIPMVFGGISYSTLEVEIFRTFFRDFNFQKGAYLAFIQLLIFIPIAFAWKTLPWKIGLPNGKKNNWAYLISIIYLLVFCLILAGPLLRFKFTQISLEPVINSLMLASLSAFVAISMFVIFARFVSKFVFVLFAISPAVLGVSYYYLPGSFILLPIGHALIAFPLVAAILMPYTKEIRKFSLAGSVLGANPLNRFLHIHLPLLLPAYLLAFLFAFAFSLGESAFILSVSGGFNTMSTVLLQAFSAYRFSEGYFYVAILIYISVIISLVIEFLPMNFRANTVEKNVH